MPWQQQVTQSEEQQELWQKVEAMSQSPHFCNWMPIAQRHPQGRYTLQTQHYYKDKQAPTLSRKHRRA